MREALRIKKNRFLNRQRQEENTRPVRDGSPFKVAYWNANGFSSSYVSSYNHQKDFAFTLYQGKSPLKISSGLFFDEEWLGFERQLFAHLSVLNLQSTLELEIRNSMSKMVQFKFKMSDERKFPICKASRMYRKCITVL